MPFSCCALSSCSGTQEEDTAQETAGVMESTTETETLAAEKAYIRESKDFDEKTFNVIADLETGNNLYYDDLTIVEETDEVLNDAVFQRNLKVIEDYNVKLTSSCITESEAQMVNAVSAGDNAYDAAAFRLNDAYKYTNYCVDLMALENLSIGESWWDSNSVENLSVAGTLKMIAGDIFYKHYNGVYMLLFNKNMYNDFGLADPYEMVKNGECNISLSFLNKE